MTKITYNADTIFNRLDLALVLTNPLVVKVASPNVNRVINLSMGLFGNSSISSVVTQKKSKLANKTLTTTATLTTLVISLSFIWPMCLY